ncbi:MAG: TetR family transcriptional regulator [Actinomycetales bacterium]|nr:TetR family transcriptional regulator [Actinomycetales bacterium]
MGRLGRRPVGGPDTREAILAAGRELFAERGFDRTTMRAVAAKAEVDPALIHHYFGTKEGLLTAVLELPMDPVALLGDLGGDPERAGDELVRRVLGFWEDAPETRERMVALLRTGLSHDTSAALLRDLLGRTILAALERSVAPDRPRLRAALIGTQMGGMLLARYLLRVPGVAEATVDELALALGPTIQRYLTGSLDAEPDRPAP